MTENLNNKYRNIHNKQLKRSKLKNQKLNHNYHQQQPIAVQQVPTKQPIIVILKNESKKLNKIKKMI